MPLILNIDTAVQSASICLANGDKVIAVAVNPTEKDSAAWLHVSIENVLREHRIAFEKISAIAVSAGPGSYTGLRVGMATAKGFCYALSVPLITVSTLQMMAASAQPFSNSDQLLCPMIDARRMEVFTALFDQSLHELMPATSVVLDENFFHQWLQKHNVLFFGNGSEKAKELMKHSQATFLKIESTAANMCYLSAQKFAQHQFSDLAYAEPFYGKEFHLPSLKKISKTF